MFWGAVVRIPSYNSSVDSRPDEHPLQELMIESAVIETYYYLTEPGAEKPKLRYSNSQRDAIFYEFSSGQSLFRIQLLTQSKSEYFYSTACTLLQKQLSPGSVRQMGMLFST